MRTFHSIYWTVHLTMRLLYRLWNSQGRGQCIIVMVNITIRKAKAWSYFIVYDYRLIYRVSRVLAKGKTCLWDHTGCSYPTSALYSKTSFSAIQIPIIPIRAFEVYACTTHGLHYVRYCLFSPLSSILISVRVASLALKNSCVGSSAHEAILNYMD